MSWKVKKTEEGYLIWHADPHTKELWSAYKSKRKAREMVNNLNSFGAALDE